MLFMSPLLLLRLLFVWLTSMKRVSFRLESSSHDMIDPADGFRSTRASYVKVWLELERKNMDQAQVSQARPGSRRRRKSPFTWIPLRHGRPSSISLKTPGKGEGECSTGVALDMTWTRPGWSCVACHRPTAYTDTPRPRHTSFARSHLWKNIMFLDTMWGVLDGLCYSWQNFLK